MTNDHSSLASDSASTRVQRRLFGTLSDATPIDLYTLSNTNGVQVALITYGGIIVSLQTPDRRGRIDDIVLGFDTFNDYLQHSPYFGAIVGRYANRIAGGRFTLDGVTYQLTQNEGENHLHGGARGFDKVVWQALPRIDGNTASVRLTYESANGEEGYPGTVQVGVTYTLTPDNMLQVEYDATTDRPTPINLTQHTYFNLTGAHRDVLGHTLQIEADAYTPVDERLIPTGEIRSVVGTPFDFRRPKAIGTHIYDDDVQLHIGNGYDHNLVLTQRETCAITVFEPESGRTLEISTTEPGVQFYSGNLLDGVRGKEGRTYDYRFGFCLETQHFPDSPNHLNFPTTILQPGDRYSSHTEYRFGVSQD